MSSNQRPLPTSSVFRSVLAAGLRAPRPPVHIAVADARGLFLHYLHPDTLTHLSHSASMSASHPTGPSFVKGQLFGKTRLPTTSLGGRTVVITGAHVFYSSTQACNLVVDFL